MLLRLALIFFQDQKYTILCPSSQKNFCWEIWAYLYKWLGIFPLLPQHNLSKDTGMGWKYDSVAKSACHTTMRTWVDIFLPVSGAPVLWGGVRRFFYWAFLATSQEKKYGLQVLGENLSQRNTEKSYREHLNSSSNLYTCVHT